MNRKAAGIIAGTLAAAIAITAGVNCRASYAVFRNLTARKLSLDGHAQWSGGRNYEKVPYAGDSVSQYLDLLGYDVPVELSRLKLRY